MLSLFVIQIRILTIHDIISYLPLYWFFLAVVSDSVVPEFGISIVLSLGFTRAYTRWSVVLQLWGFELFIESNAPGTLWCDLPFCYHKRGAVARKPAVSSLGTALFGLKRISGILWPFISRHVACLNGYIGVGWSTRHFLKKLNCQPSNYSELGTYLN